LLFRLARAGAICCKRDVTGASAITQEKAALRARQRAWRDGLDGAAKVRAAEAIADLGVALVSELRRPDAFPGRSGVVSGFASLPEELNVWPLLRRLCAAGVPLALPVVAGKGQPLVFRAWTPGDAMDKGVWDIPEPKADRPVLEPDILLVPMLAFDSHGNRLGYGGGFYDRTLAGLRARKAIVAMGLAYDGQRVNAVPHHDYDQRLDWVLTPSGPVRCQHDASVVPR
jgi:5-formyltetrahydrofolate cyclo-ligase